MTSQNVGSLSFILKSEPSYKYYKNEIKKKYKTWGIRPKFK
jgi:hypothetical protein